MGGSIGHKQAASERDGQCDENSEMGVSHH